MTMPALGLLVGIVAHTYSGVHRAVMPTAEKGQSQEEALGDVPPTGRHWRATLEWGHRPPHDRRSQ